MSYSLFWRTPALNAQKQTPITVPAGSVVSTAASLRFTGKGAANYGKIQQENQMRLLENFAGPTQPDYATVGQTWFDSSSNSLKVCVATTPAYVWHSMNATQVTNVGDAPPTPAALGDTWYQRTGSASGILYVYTGMGRFPATNWDATAASYFPTLSTTLAAQINHDTFSNTNYNEAYICGITSGSPSDTDGTILIGGTATSVPRGVMSSQFPNSNGFIVWDRTGSMVSLVNGGAYFQVRQTLDGTWQYDNTGAWVTFTPVPTMYAIGRISIGSQDQNAAPGITSAVMWSTAVPVGQLDQVPTTLPNGAIGGWAQIFPTVDMIGGREEYDYIASLVGQLIDDSASGAAGRAVQYLTNFKTLDASLRDAWLALSPPDSNVTNAANLRSLSVDPTSQDWDYLLTAAKYAVNRLELPAESITDLSDMPFVNDGRAVPADIAALTDYRAPSSRRIAQRRLGSISVSRLYQETVNVLSAAIINRYVLKGMLGLSGTNTAFSSTVAVANQVSFSANAAGSPFASSVSHGIQYRWNYSTVDMSRYFGAGQALELVIRHAPSGSPTAADTNLKTITDQFGRFRITNDSTYVMTSSVTPVLSQSPGSTGAQNMTSSGVVFGSATVGGASIVVRGLHVGRVNLDDVAQVYVDVVAGGPTTGTFTVTWNVITDNETYGSSSTRVYPTVNPYVAGDKLGSSLFV